MLVRYFIISMLPAVCCLCSPVIMKKRDTVAPLFLKTYVEYL